MDPSLPLALPVPGMASTAPKSTKSKTQGKEGAILVPSTNIPPNASAPKSSGPEFALKRRQTFRDPEGKHGDLVSNLAEDDSEEEDDPTERYRSLLQLFDTHKAWKPAEPGEDWYAAVTKFLARHPKLCKRLDETDDEGKTLLHMIVTQPRRRKNALSNLKPFDRRRDFFKWVMREVPELYKTMDEGTGSTVLSLATNRVGRPMIKEELKNESREFIEFFVELYPKETAELLKDVDVDNSKMKQLQLHLVHELLPILQDRRSNLSRSLLGYLDKNTIMNRDRDGNTVLHLASRYHFMCDESPESHKELRQGIKKLLEVCPEALTSLNYARESPYQYRVSTYKAYSKSKSEIVDSAKLPLPDDSIAQLLKDKYMHLLQRDETIKYLHGDVQEYEIHVDLQELSKVSFALSEEDLKGLVDSLKLENILQYVRIPHYKLASTSAVPKARNFVNHNNVGHDGIGRKDYQQIFDLLWNKGVRKIIKIMVEDNEDIPHSDEVLEKLSRFDIEEWDWKRTDLCSDVLFKAAPNARKVTLYSSGNSAVLRSWSESEGLNRLKQLKEVNVFIRQRLESEARVNGYKDAFVSRVLKSFQNKIVVNAIVESDIGGKGSTEQALFGGGEKATAWLENMDKFARFIANIPQELVSPGSGVKVAVLDDGIDAVQGGFGNSIKEGVSFYTPQDRKTRPYYFSSIGHGTEMANLIRRVCPPVQLYIARLHQYFTADGTRMQPTPESAAKAIRWAIKKNVDIISMSWTIVKTGNNMKGIEALEAAIKDAREKKILMFGAASDQGYNESNPNSIYPVSAGGVFCIGAAKVSGQAEDAAERESHYVFPGRNISSAPRRMSKTNDLQASIELTSSSSFATALASGLAALILYCVEITEEERQQSQKYRNIEPSPINRKDLTTYDTMKSIFDSMVAVENKKYIAVKTFFDAKFADRAWEDDGEERLVDSVAKIIRPYTDNLALYSNRP